MFLRRRLPCLIHTTYFSFSFLSRVTNLCEILIAILSVYPSVTLQCCKKQQTHRKADGGETSTVGGEMSSECAKRPSGETSRGRNVLLLGRWSRQRNTSGPTGRTSWAQRWDRRPVGWPVVFFTYTGIFVHSVRWF